MSAGSIARRYAKALFELAVERGEVEAFADALISLKRALAAAPELEDVLVNPVYTREQRRGIAAELARELALPRDLANLLALLADRNRLGELGGVAEVFGGLADEKLGRVRARVVSAVPLEAAAAERLSERLARATRASVIVERAVDPELVGGVVAQVGRFTYDGSIKSQLEDLRRALKR
ncbi:MAG TPA: ATP synthase F1 subunit delta [Anaeromyxobacteraceae bacterium]|nr:ATP synthase F1 subunit delta [Anaeromyxobacteraceae bacterium]HUK66931.1 ATP synthase F1 subunit delta [Anaeromyxobacteraceae bacterium]